MRWLSPRERRLRTVRAVRLVTVGFIAFAVLTVLDAPVFGLLRERHYELTDDHMLARVLGHLPTWLLLAAAVTLAQHGQLRWPFGHTTRWRGRAVLALLAVAVAAAAMAEGLTTAAAALTVWLAVLTRLPSRLGAATPGAGLGVRTPVGGARGLSHTAAAWLVVLAAALSGLVAEVLKRVIGRERPFVPREGDAQTLERAGAFWVRLTEPLATPPAQPVEPPTGAYVWKEGPLVGGWLDDGNLGMPSSHTAVAAGALLMLCRLYPPLVPACVALALLTGWQRVASGAHFLTDAFVAVVIGALVSGAIASRAGRPR